jgi:hypothetical protein
VIYSLIGRAVVKFGWVYLRRRVALRTLLLAGAGVAAGFATVGVVGYLATRDVPEA